MKTIPITKTIMFTDIVGYSTLVSNNETLAMSLLDEHNNILMSLFEKYDGKVIKHTGDGFFVTFEDSNKSIECSIEFQNKLDIFVDVAFANHICFGKLRTAVYPSSIVLI